MQKPEQKVADWGRQTIVFAMNTRALDLGKSTDDPDHIRIVAGEAHRLVGQFWEEAFEAAPKPAQLHHVVMPFVKKVLDWVVSHLT